MEANVSLSREHRPFVSRMPPPCLSARTDNIYNNWFVSKVSFWLRPDVQDFLLHVNRTHVIYTERWGDLLWQSSALQLFMDQGKLWMFNDFAYEHASFSKVPFPANPTWKLARLQGLNRTCLAYGGIALASQGGGSSSSSMESSQDAARARLRTLASTPLCRHYRDGRYVMRPCVVHDGAAYVKGGGPRTVTSYLLGSVSTVQAGCGRSPTPLWCNTSASKALLDRVTHGGRGHTDRGYRQVQAGLGGLCCCHSERTSRFVSAVSEVLGVQVKGVSLHTLRTAPRLVAEKPKPNEQD